MHLISVLEDRSSKRDEIMGTIVVATPPPMSDTRYLNSLEVGEIIFLLVEFKKESVSQERRPFELLLKHKSR